VALEGGATLSLHRHGEVYRLALPDLALGDPTAPACGVRFKGEMSVVCAATGLAACLAFRRDGGVRGNVERRGAGSARSTVGVLSGSWRGVVSAACAGELAGAVFDAAAGPPLLADVDLSRLGPLRGARLWAAIHDALLYCDRASGGGAARRALRRLAAGLSQLSLPGDDAGDAYGRRAAAADARAARAGGGGGDGGKSAAGAGAESDSSFESDGGGGGGGGGGGRDERDVPPCVQAQHAEGRRLAYTLRYELVDVPPPPPPPPGGAATAAAPA